ncbi:SH3 domain-containing protein [uncultured Chryseobacterium sp.]|uniref:SH3 domain-containing protein n=1 Tax=uncultured Chryseobacterium sp. TaxID=259322 RepID=UPI0025DF2091|nr:SH3 domain-containing protein [uncultured Chryseobacterium sp.]
MLKLLFHKLMNRMYLLILISIFFSCNNPSQEKKSADVEKNVASLTASLNKKDEVTFLENFPKDFKTFIGTFGWNDQKDIAEPLYKNANAYIDYWFLLIQQPKYKSYENQMINISKNGYWQADAVGYFQKCTINYIEKNKKYNLINSLPTKDAESVLSFLLNNTQNTSDFISHLDKDKQQLATKIGSKKNSTQKTRGTLETYVNNKSFFIRTFDINKDGILDKIASNVAYEGEDLFVFYGNKAGGYDEVLETRNFSEDGGNIIKDVYEIKGEKGFMVKTYFPDRGYYEKEFYIIPENNTWILKNIIYKTMSDMSENAVKYICDVSQNIDITKSGWSEKLQPIPEEDERNKKCRTENINNAAKQYFIQDPDGYTNVRSGKSTSSEIIQKVKSGEQVEVLNDNGDWFVIKTKEGKQGYVYRNRIRSSQ